MPAAYDQIVWLKSVPSPSEAEDKKSRFLAEMEFVCFCGKKRNGPGANNLSQNHVGWT